MKRNQAVKGSLLITAMLAIVAGLAGGQTNSITQKPRVNTFPLGTIPISADGALLVSADCRHAAIRVQRGLKWKMFLDGVEGAPYENISAPLFSPDGKRLAYVATKGLERQTVVIDGKEGAEYEFVDRNSLAFSPDSQHVAFVSTPPHSSNVWVVLDGKEGAKFHAICHGLDDGYLLFSPNSKRLVYGAILVTNNAAITDFVVVEGDRPKICPAKGALRVAGFSPDALQIAWMEECGAKQRMVVDGKAGKAYHSVGYFRFSPDGKRTAYLAKQDDKWKVVLDDRESSAFDEVTETLVFSADSRHVAVTAIRGNMSFVVQDDHEGSPYEWAGAPVFSSDSQHLAYFAKRGTRHVVVRDGRESPEYDGLGMAPVFSPDGRHLAYAARQGDSWCFVLDGKPGKEYYKPLRWLCFSPDSAHLAYGAASGTSGTKVVVVLDEQELCEYQGAGMGTLIFDGPNLLRCVLNRMDEGFTWRLQRLEIGLVSQ